jgi:hypothetical protein
LASINSKLKKAGLLPANWDLRSGLTPGQKSWASKQANKYKGFLVNPQGYSVKSVSKKTAKLLKESQFPTSGRRAVIAKEGADKVSISRGRIVYKNENETRSLILASGKAALDLPSKLRRTKLKRGEFWGIKIGNSPRINILNQSFETLEQYAQTMVRKSGDTSEHLHFVKVKLKSIQGVSFEEIEEDEEDEEERSKNRRR